MKNLIHLFVLLFVSAHLFAQKVDMDRNAMAISHNFYPSSPVLAAFKTFEARISEPAGFLSSYGSNRVMVIQNFVNIGGYQRVETGGDFILDLILDGLKYNENRVVTHSSTDKSGKVSNSYQFKISFYIPVTLRILDASQKTITTREARGIKHLSEWNSNVYANRRDLDNYMESNRKQIMSSLVGKYIENAFTDISTSLTKEFGFREEVDWVGFYELDSKSHPEYENYKKHIESMEKEFKTFKSGMDISAAKMHLQPANDYFAGLIPKLNKDDKQQFKLLKHTLINLIRLNFYLDDFEAYKKYNEILATVEDKDYWEGSEVKSFDKLYNEMNAVGAKSLYAVRDMTPNKVTAGISPIVEATKPAEVPMKASVEEIDLSRLKRNPSDRVIPGTYTGLDNAETNGYFVIGPGDDERFIFNGSLANTFFVYMDDKGVAKTKPLHPKKLKSFSFEKHQFIVFDYKSAMLFASKAASIMEVLSDNPNIKLYKYYPEDGDAETADDYEFVFIRTVDQKPISFTGKDMFWKKKAKEYFAACPGIVEEIEKLKFVSPNKTISTSWAALYAECGK